MIVQDINIIVSCILRSASVHMFLLLHYCQMFSFPATVSTYCHTCRYKGDTTTGLTAMQRINLGKVVYVCHEESIKLNCFAFYSVLRLRH